MGWGAGQMNSLRIRCGDLLTSEMCHYPHWRSWCFPKKTESPPLNGLTFPETKICLKGLHCHGFLSGNCPIGWRDFTRIALMFCRLSGGKEFIAAADWFLFSVWSQNIYLLSLSAQVHVLGPWWSLFQKQGIRNVLLAYLEDYPPGYLENRLLEILWWLVFMT